MNFQGINLEAADRLRLFKGFNGELGASGFDRSFSISLAFSNKSRTLLTNIETGSALTPSFPPFVHVLNKVLTFM